MEKNYYMLRMLNYERKFSNKLFYNYNYITIGWSFFNEAYNGDYLNVYKNSNDKEKLLRDTLEKTGCSLDGRKVASHRILHKFLEMKIGDIVIIPDYKTFHIAEIKSEPILFSKIKNECGFGENDNPDIGFVYKIEKVKNLSGKSAISREKFADGTLTSRLKARNGFLIINDLKYSVEESKKNFLNNEVLILSEIIKEGSRKNIIEALKKCLSPDKFEKFLTNLMLKLGADKVDIPSKNNKENAVENYADVDVIAIFEKLKHIIYIQAKFHNGKTSDWAVKQLDTYDGEKDTENDYTTAYWAITTGEFSEQAKEYTKNSNKNIRLIDQSELADLILSIGTENLDL